MLEITPDAFRYRLDDGTGGDLVFKIGLTYYLLKLDCFNLMRDMISLIKLMACAPFM